MLLSIFNYFKNKADQARLDSQIMRLAQTEYLKDWEYAYQRLSIGKQPYVDD